MLEIVSSHIPKCAGISLRKSLTKCFGKQSVYLDYFDRMDDPNSLFNRDQTGYWKNVQNRDLEDLEGKKVVHGHFHIRKYERFSNSFRLTFLRHPVDRLISHYYYWLRTKPDGTHSLHTYIKENQIPIEEFARIPIIRFYYTKKYFSNIQVSSFDFIGFYEEFSTDLARLSKILGKELPLYWKNKRPKGSDQSLLSNKKRSLLFDLLIEDVRFYDHIRSSS